MMAMEAWTMKGVKEQKDYTLVQMNEQVSLYYSKYRNKTGLYFTDVRFFGPHHKKRAEVYATLTGSGWWTEDRGTASTVRVLRK